MKIFKKHRSLGFTLVELLFVVSIIGILAAIGLPQFHSYRQRAYNAAALQDLKNSRLAAEGFYAENLHYPY